MISLTPNLRDTTPRNEWKTEALKSRMGGDFEK
jgi:hypothetical protein